MARKSKGMPESIYNEPITKISIARRQVTVTNYNPKPEKHGDERVRRANLSISMFLEKDEAAALLRTRTGASSAILWAPGGDLQLIDVDSIPLRYAIEGKATIKVRGVRKELKFDDAKLYKMAIEPQVGHGAVVTGQLRIDPSSVGEELELAQVLGECVLEFAGTIEGEDGGEPDPQMRLEDAE